MKVSKAGKIWLDYHRIRPKIKTQYDILEKETVDEIIFRTVHPRNRLMLELMARCAMRIGEVLKIVPKDISERKILLREPKSGRKNELIFIPQKVADRLREYIESQNIGSHDRVFPICYEAARSAVVKAGNLVGIHLRPHDLRRHAATYASRSGVPLEIVSKIILRHSNLSTTQIYLGRISDTEALKWIEDIYSKMKRGWNPMPGTTLQTAIIFAHRYFLGCMISTESLETSTVLFTT